MDYENLSVAVEPKPEGGFQARALASPFGPATAPFDLPFRREDFEALIREVRACVVASFSVRDVGASLEKPAQRSAECLRRVGAALFRALLGGPVREIYLLSRGRIDSKPDRGLRIRVVLPVDCPEAGLLQAVPWELLYCEETREVLARGARTPVVRSLPLPWASVPFSDADASPTRVLIVVANPRGTDRLDAKDECDRLRQAWQPRGKLAIKILLGCTLRDLTEALKADSYQAVHFITHGAFDPRSGTGSLLLEAPDGGAHSVQGSVLGETLGSRRELRAVFLNACRTSQAGSQAGQDPLLGTAAALVRAGVPAVLAMQFPISDLGARIFSETVYRSLAWGSGLDQSVAEGRLALVQDDPDSREWGTPTLFSALSETDVLGPWVPPVEHLEAAREEAFAQLGVFLRNEDYATALEAASAALKRAPETADFHYCLALALLRGRRARHLKPSQLRPIEAAARRATRCSDRAAHHFCLLAFLVHDFYVKNHLPTPPPPFESLMNEGRRAPRVSERLAELQELLPATAAIAAQLDEPTERSAL